MGGGREGGGKRERGRWEGKTEVGGGRGKGEWEGRGEEKGKKRREEKSMLIAHDIPKRVLYTHSKSYAEFLEYIPLSLLAQSYSPRITSNSIPNMGGYMQGRRGWDLPPVNRKGASSATAKNGYGASMDSF